MALDLETHLREDRCHPSGEAYSRAFAVPANQLVERAVEALFPFMHEYQERTGVAVEVICEAVAADSTLFALGG